MKQRMKNEMVQNNADLILWRRFGHGFWFQVRCTSLARERRHFNLARVLTSPAGRFSGSALAPQRPTESFAL